MTPYTQSNLEPGNCWQTAVASIIDVEPEALPPQHEIEALEHDVLEGFGSYSNVLNGYLMKHHRVVYSTVWEPQFTSVRPVMEHHVMCGPTVRTEAHAREGRKHVHHAVVGRLGEQVWDVHPSRAGLLSADQWGVLGEIDAKAAAQRVNKWGAERIGAHLVYNCLCPACGLSELRERADRMRLVAKIVSEMEPGIGRSA